MEGRDWEKRVNPSAPAVAAINNNRISGIEDRVGEGEKVFSPRFVQVCFRARAGVATPAHVSRAEVSNWGHNTWLVLNVDPIKFTVTGK